MSTQGRIGAAPTSSPTGVAAIPDRIREGDPLGQPRQLAGGRRAGDHRHLLRLHRRQLLHSRSTSTTRSFRWTGTTMLAYGVVFVLLIGEIDLSIGFVSGVAGIIVAQLLVPESGHQIPDVGRSRPAPRHAAWRCSRARRSASSRARSSHSIGVPAFRRHARRPLDLAGRDPEGAARAGDGDPGQHDQQRGRSISSATAGGWAMRSSGRRRVRGNRLSPISSTSPRHGVSVRDPAPGDRGS